MTRERVRALLEQVAAGRATIDQALAQLDGAPFDDLQFARIDHHRALRHGYPEVVFGEGKSVDQTVAICEQLAASGDGFLATRTNAEQRAALVARFEDAFANELARTVRLRGRALHGEADELATAEAVASRRQAGDARGGVLVVTAGTADLPVAEEAAETLCALGLRAERLVDVGVAGIHRVLGERARVTAATVIIVVAGMDGALPSVIGGLARAPVIAVPTSVGYGASFHGLAALLTMLNSCAAGVTVCNIDNGFGAAMAAARIVGV
jgi:NCAIR mutase (PurE)-related protein